MALSSSVFKASSVSKSGSRTNAPVRTVRCAVASKDKVASSSVFMAVAGVAAANLLGAQLALAEFRMPPIDSDPNRCDRGYVGNTIGQANAVSSKSLDLRFCDYSGKDLSNLTLSGAFMSDADFSRTNLKQSVLTKSYGVNANFKDADMTNAVIDRSDFSKADFSGAKFVNAVITGTVFNNSILTGTNFEDALIGSEDVKRLCENPTLVGESRDQVGCRQ